MLKLLFQIACLIGLTANVAKAADDWLDPKANQPRHSVGANDNWKTVRAIKARHSVGVKNQSVIREEQMSENLVNALNLNQK